MMRVVAWCSVTILFRQSERVLNLTFKKNTGPASDVTFNEFFVSENLFRRDIRIYHFRRVATRYRRATYPLMPVGVNNKTRVVASLK